MQNEKETKTFFFYRGSLFAKYFWGHGGFGTRGRGEATNMKSTFSLLHAWTRQEAQERPSYKIMGRRFSRQYGALERV
jgi:hypothetical protein